MRFLYRQNRHLLDYSSVIYYYCLFVVFGHCSIDDSSNTYSLHHHHGSPVASSPGSVQVFYKWVTVPPKISFMSHTLTGDTIDITTGSKVHLRCTGQRPMVWIFPNNNNPQFDHNYQFHNLTVNSGCDQTATHIDYSPTRCWTEVTIPEAGFDMTGYYVCQYNMSSQKQSAALSNYMPIYQNVLSAQSSDQITPLSTDLMDMVYIFVNDPDNLMVPFEGQSDFLFIAVFQLQPATIPCRPTYSKAKVKLWKMQTKGKDSETEIKPNSTLGISFNPKKGFYFDNARWDSDSHSMACHFEVEGLPPLKTSISIHWSFLPADLHPLIDDSHARHILENHTFSLRCFVHIEIGVIIVVDWQYPNKTLENSKRITKSHIETQRINVNGNSYDTVSLNITVTNATLADQGDYRCNVTDGNGRIFSTVKRIHVLDKHLPPTINFTTDLDTTNALINDAGDDVRLTVVVNAYPDISMFNLTWFKDGQRLELDTSHYQIETFSDVITSISFYIPKTRSSDSGVYTLVGNYSEVSANISFTINVSGLPELIIPNVRQFYIVNQSYELVCQSYSFPISSVWWSWIPCEQTSVSMSSCFSQKHSKGVFYANNDTTWRNMTQDNDNEDDNKAIVHLDGALKRYLNVSTLRIGSATRSGVFRCSAINMYRVVQHYQLPFVVMDAEELFGVTSSTDEPTINDTIIVTCKASVIEYESIRWITAKEHLKNLNASTNTTNAYSLTSIILLRSVQLNDSATFACDAKRRNGKVERKEIFLNVKNVSSPSIMDTNMENEVIEKNYDSQFELRCYVSGRPTPHLTWYQNGKELFSKHDSGIRVEDRGQRLAFTRLLDKDSGVYECRASNRGGTVVRKAFLRVKGNPDNPDGTIQPGEILITIFLVLLGIVMLLMALFIGKKIRDEKLHKRELEFFSKSIFENGQMEMFNPEMPLDEQIDLLPYDSRFEFPKERLRLGRTLGQGAFGRVVKAEAIGLESDESVTTVAVKMLKERADANQRKALMAELKILIHLGRHLNIVNLLGAVTKNITRGELLVIVEYCEFGNLRHFLMSNRESFVNELEPPPVPERPTEYQNVDVLHSCVPMPDSPITPTSPHSPTFPSNDYINTNGNGSVGGRGSQLAYYNHNYVSGGNGGAGGGGGGGGSFTSSFTFRRHRHSRRVTTSDLICFAFQCARGMEYLTSRKLIHRDLAARNVLLASSNVVKICDFGLAKDVYKYDNYVKKDNGPLPIKWMAIESISDKIFTSKSDVWSYAILLWEIFTLGKNPYPGIEIDEEFYKRLKAGYRMEKPDYASDRVYSLMARCWDASPNERPDFGEIVGIIGDLMDEKVRQHYIDLNNPYSEMNQQIFSRSDDYLKMTSMSSGYTEEYLKMKDDTDQEDGSESVKLDEQNNNSASVIAAAAAAAANLAPSSPSPVTVMIPADGHEMIGMQNLNHLNQSLQAHNNVHCLHYDNLNQVVVTNGSSNSSNNNNTLESDEKDVVVSGVGLNHLNHHLSHLNHHLNHHQIQQQTIL